MAVGLEGAIYVAQVAIEAHLRAVGGQDDPDGVPEPACIQTTNGIVQEGVPVPHSHEDRERKAALVQRALQRSTLSLGQFIVGRSAAHLQIVVLDLAEAFVRDATAPDHAVEEREDLLLARRPAKADQEDRVHRLGVTDHRMLRRLSVSAG